MKVWGILRTDNKIVKDEVFDFEYKHVSDIPDINAILKRICYAMDLSCPILLKSHIRDLEHFNRVVFVADDFIESIWFDKFEIEILREKKS
ncbi:MAG: hypothetical protein RR232_02070 [Clostridia bacterium]